MNENMRLIEGYFFNELTEKEIQEVKKLYETDIIFKKAFIDYQHTLLVLEEMEARNELESLQNSSIAIDEEIIIPKKRPYLFQKTRWAFVASILMIVFLSYWGISYFSKIENKPTVSKKESYQKNNPKDTTQKIRTIEQPKVEKPQEKPLPLEKPKEETMLALHNAPNEVWDEEVKSFEGKIAKSDNRGNEVATIKILKPQNRNQLKDKVVFEWKNEEDAIYLLRIINNKQTTVFKSDEFQANAYVWEIKDAPIGRYYWQLSILRHQDKEETVFVGEFFVVN
jgi:hypothetical protein